MRSRPWPTRSRGRSTPSLRARAGSSRGLPRLQNVGECARKLTKRNVWAPKSGGPPLPRWRGSGSLPIVGSVGVLIRGGQARWSGRWCHGCTMRAAGIAGDSYLAQLGEQAAGRSVPGGSPGVLAGREQVDRGAARPRVCREAAGPGGECHHGGRAWVRFRLPRCGGVRWNGAQHCLQPDLGGTEAKGEAFRPLPGCRPSK